MFVFSYSQGNLFANIALKAVAKALPQCEPVWSKSALPRRLPVNSNLSTRRHMMISLAGTVVDAIAPASVNCSIEMEVSAK